MLSQEEQLLTCGGVGDPENVMVFRMAATLPRTAPVGCVTVGCVTICCETVGCETVGCVTVGCLAKVNFYTTMSNCHLAEGGTEPDLKRGGGLGDTLALIK